VAELFISRQAEADLRSIWRYIASDNPAAADRVLLGIDKRMQILRRFPEIGALRNDIRRGMRMLVEASYLSCTSTIRRKTKSNSWPLSMADES
jgi:toxin ParE1/3/4